MKKIILISILSLIVHLSYSQDIFDCMSVCAGEEFPIDAACTDNQGGGPSDYTYTVSSAPPDATVTPLGNGQFTVNTTGMAIGDNYSIFIMCVCIDGGCDYNTEFIFDVTDGPEMVCLYEQSAGGFGPASEGDCVHIVCEGDDGVVVIDDAAGTQPANQFTYSWSTGSPSPIGQQNTLCANCNCTQTPSGEIDWAVTITEVATGCQTIEEGSLMIKCTVMEPSCN